MIPKEKLRPLNIKVDTDISVDELLYLIIHQYNFYSAVMYEFITCASQLVNPEKLHKRLLPYLHDTVYDYTKFKSYLSGHIIEAISDDTDTAYLEIVYILLNLLHLEYGE